MDQDYQAAKETLRDAEESPGFRESLRREAMHLLRSAILWRDYLNESYNDWPWCEEPVESAPPLTPANGNPDK